MTNPVTKFTTDAQGIPAGSTPTYRGVLKDASATSQAVGSGSVSALTLSITDDATGAVVNNCNQADILNTGRGTLDADGNLEITLTADDTAMLRGEGKENRSLTIDFKYPGPGGITAVGRHRVIFTVYAMPGD